MRHCILLELRAVIHQGTGYRRVTESWRDLPPWMLSTRPKTVANERRELEDVEQSMWDVENPVGSTMPTVVRVHILTVQYRAYGLLRRMSRP